jgi:hypothetical protein
MFAVRSVSQCQRRFERNAVRDTAEAWMDVVSTKEVDEAAASRGLEGWWSRSEEIHFHRGKAGEALGGRRGEDVSSCKVPSVHSGKWNVNVLHPGRGADLHPITLGHNQALTFTHRPAMSASMPARPDAGAD